MIAGGDSKKWGKEKLQTGYGGVLRPTQAGVTGSNDQIAYEGSGGYGDAHPVSQS
ncbi:unnamed protein product [Spirodela intermedia]|uniref:Uncharacterized protein n=1 Tax=Spirodela intermedia TaxID=51605 RepID=A0A7I8KFU7_SPIIN|nr:unnamed protein product [Spirodela intermedia]